MECGQSMPALWGYVDGTVCTHTGKYSQLGRMGRFDATCTYTSGEAGTATYADMNNRVAVFDARLQMQSPRTGCRGSIPMTAPRPEEQRRRRALAKHAPRPNGRN